MDSGDDLVIQELNSRSTFEGSWTPEQKKSFYLAMDLYDKDTPNRWQKVAKVIGGKSAEEVERYYCIFLEDVKRNVGKAEEQRLAADDYKGKDIVSSSTDQPAHPRKFTVLSVENDPLIQTWHSELLDRHKLFEITTAANVKYAVHFIHSGSSFDLILMNGDTPDGAQAIRDLRATGVQSLIVGMILSIDDDDTASLTNELMKAGSNEVLMKPLSEDGIDSLVQELSRRAGL